MGNLTFCKALAGGAFAHVNDQNFAKKSNAQGFACRVGWVLLKLTDALMFYLLHSLIRKCEQSNLDHPDLDYLDYSFIRIFFSGSNVFMNIKMESADTSSI